MVRRATAIRSRFSPLIGHTRERCFGVDIVFLNPKTLGLSRFALFEFPVEIEDISQFGRWMREGKKEDDVLNGFSQNSHSCFEPVRQLLL